jgi:purine-binding chemotaxis protein CheW
MTSAADIDQSSQGYVTVVTAGQLFGLPLERVRDVFVPRGLSKVPLAPPEVAGLLNLRGRIVTAIDLRRRLGLAPRSDESVPIAIGMEQRGELYGLIADRAGDVLHLKRSTYETNPVNLDGRWAHVCAGVHRLEHELMVVLDVEKMLDFKQFGIAV